MSSGRPSTSVPATRRVTEDFPLNTGPQLLSCPSHFDCRREPRSMGALPLAAPTGRGHSTRQLIWARDHSLGVLLRNPHQLRRHVWPSRSEIEFLRRVLVEV